MHDRPWAAPSSRTYFSQRLRLHYLDWGNEGAPALLLVHGNRDHCHAWDWVAERFAHDHHVVAPDLRGHGDSQWSRGTTYSSMELVYDLAQLVRQARLAPLAIVAHSMGGGIALKYAGMYPETVRKLVLVEGMGGFGSWRAQQPIHERLASWIDSTHELAGRLPRRYASLDEAYERLRRANGRLTPEQARHLTRHGTSQNEDGTFSWKFDNYTHARTPYEPPDEDVVALRRRVGCPVLLVTGADSWGRRGRLARLGALGRLGRRLGLGNRGRGMHDFANARHVEIARAGHWVHHDQLDHFVKVVRAFLST